MSNKLSNKVNKLMIIGIDSLDPTLLHKFSDSLPNFKKLIDESPTFKTKSIFPPDTIPAWITIYTGLNPARHGIIHTFDLFETSWLGKNVQTDNFKGITFWDILSNNDKKVCVLFPQCAFPPWNVSGIMVSRPLYPIEELKNKGIIIENESMACPDSICKSFRFLDYGCLDGHHPGFKNLKLYKGKAKENVLNQTQLGLKISGDYQWDLFFIYFSELDIIQHFFWRYYDENDPTYPNDNPYKNVIKEFYELFDSIIGRFIDAYPDTVKIILSDHGHKMRPPNTVNINEFLRGKGYIKYKKRSYVLEKVKMGFLDFVHDYDLTYWLMKIGKMKMFANTSKKIYTSSSVIDINDSLAYLSYFTGAKSYSEGGIHINNVNVDYENFRNKLIDELYTIRDMKKNKVFEWIKRREELYDGKYINLYPDIVFKLKDEFGVFWSINTEIIGRSYEHNVSSGGHKEDAVLLISNHKKAESIKDNKDNISILDIAPTILGLYGINGKSYAMDGENIFKRGKNDKKLT